MLATIVGVRGEAGLVSHQQLVAFFLQLLDPLVKLLDLKHLLGGARKSRATKPWYHPLFADPQLPVEASEGAQGVVDSELLMELESSDLQRETHLVSQGLRTRKPCLLLLGELHLPLTYAGAPSEVVHSLCPMLLVRR